MNIRFCTATRLPVLLLTMMFLYACQGIPAGLPADPGERVLSGDRVQVNRELTVAAHKASVILQHGSIISGSGIDRFGASCRFVMKEIKNAPQKIVPGEFLVTNVRYWEDFVAPDYRIPLSGGEFINFEITLRLHSERQPGVYSLVCKHDDEHTDGRHLRLSEMQQALGDFARIIKP